MGGSRPSFLLVPAVGVSASPCEVMNVQSLTRKLVFLFCRPDCQHWNQSGFRSDSDRHDWRSLGDRRGWMCCTCVICTPEVCVVTCRQYNHRKSGFYLCFTPTGRPITWRLKLLISVWIPWSTWTTATSSYINSFFMLIKKRNRHTWPTQWTPMPNPVNLQQSRHVARGKSGLHFCQSAEVNKPISFWNFWVWIQKRSW